MCKNLKKLSLTEVWGKEEIWLSLGSLCRNVVDVELVNCEPLCVSILPYFKDLEKLKIQNIPVLESISLPLMELRELSFLGCGDVDIESPLMVHVFILKADLISRKFFMVSFFFVLTF